MTKEVTKTNSGLWQPGQSGNPAGRPKGRKSQITQLKQELEIAVRDNLDPKAIRGILQAMADKAMEGNVGAAKLILDKVLSNAREAEEETTSSGKFVFEVANLTLKHPESPEDERNVINVTPIKETEDVHRS